MLSPKDLDKKTLLSIASVAWPMALNALLMQSISIIDLLLIASLGDFNVAAFGIGGALIAFILSIQIAIASGTQLVLSRAVGAGDIHKIGSDIASGWIISIGVLWSLIVLLYFALTPIIYFISSDSQVAALAIEYVQISLLVMFLSAMTSVVGSYFNAYRKSRIPLYGFCIEIPINILCSAALIHGLWGAPQLGLVGAAWGSVIAVCMRLFYLSYQFKREIINGYVGGFLLVSRASIFAHFFEILPIVTNFFVLFTGLLVFQGLFAQLPVSSYAAITLILPWIKAGSLFVNSWTQSSTIIVSQMLGKKDYSRIKNLVLQTKFVSVIMCLFMVTAFLAFSLLIPHIYSDLSVDTLTALAIIAPVYILIPIFRVNNMFCGNMMRAMGESYMIVRINLITQWLIAIPLCALLIYFEANVLWVFSVILIDEMLKCYPFKRALQGQLKRYT